MIRQNRQAGWAPHAAEETLTELDDLELQLVGEARDDSWASATETAIAESLAESTMIDSELASVECRATRCKLVVDHLGVDAMTSIDQHFFGSLQTFAGNANTNTDAISDDEFRTTIYLGYERPAENDMRGQG